MRKTNAPWIDAAAVLPDEARRWSWIALLTGSSVLFSLALACATPFAALAALAGLNMRRRDAVILTVAVWLANQAVGYGVLHYPRTPDSYAWGAAIGIAAMLALGAATVAGRGLDRARPVVAIAAAFSAAFVAYELALFAVSFLLPGSDGAFSWPIIGRILAINALALAGLLLLDRAARLVGLVTRPPDPIAAIAR